MIQDSQFQELLAKNKRWILDKKSQDPAYFENLAKNQSPTFLYIGCSDSRQSFNILTQSNLGELFVHRNIANQVQKNDENLLAVLEFGIEILNIKTIIVYGHHGCSGIKAAITNEAPENVRKWIHPIIVFVVEGFKPHC